MQHNISSHVNAIRDLARQIRRPVKLMEVCGTHTMAAFRCGLHSLLPDNVALLSGPGCPVCVTPTSYVDKAIALAREQDVVLATFGDMLRVPGTQSSLEVERARGARALVVYSPLDALESARRNPQSRVVFLGVGFETTSPTVAWTLREAGRRKIANFSVLCAHKLIPPAMAALLADGEVQIDGFLCPGHVSVVIGANAYDFVCRKYGIPCVVAGFEGVDMLAAIQMLLEQIHHGKPEVAIQYTRSVNRDGNSRALALLNEVFEPREDAWRGLGVIPGSGLRIRKDFQAHDAGFIFQGVSVPEAREPTGCICGLILKGTRIPTDCPLFGSECTPDMPAGACMVSSEGSCAAYYRYSRISDQSTEKKHS